MIHKIQTLPRAIQAIVFGALVFGCCGIPILGDTSPEDDVRRFLVGYADSHQADVADTHYAVGFVDLNRDGINEAVVYLTGRYWCGTGGCQTLVLARSGRTFRLVGRILATRLPIRALDRTTHGWRVLTARVRGAELTGSRRSFLSMVRDTPRPRLRG